MPIDFRQTTVTQLIMKFTFWSVVVPKLESQRYALCTSPVAKVENSLVLDQCTRTTTCYKMDNIHFWDTPGIQEWSQLEINSYVNSSALR